MPRLGFLADFAAVALGGACGAMLRHGLTLALPPLWGSRAMLGTLVANVLGCLAIGMLGQWVQLEAVSFGQRSQLLLRVGLLGSLTTFSTFAAEAWAVGGEGRTGMLLLHLSAHLLVGFAAFWLGTYLVREFAA
ncbi:fluoride efflux transporter FluC [Roseimaritima sediminicola]|uniref:fluoride efflux transporter FluC n=1 Tax=Roseimaritima sediminicola TaxID=2662066 RepID=UPI00192A2DAA|nr:CrcB family protein [Roseimaritima sediminicola]